MIVEVCSTYHRGRVLAHDDVESIERQYEEEWTLKKASSLPGARSGPPSQLLNPRCEAMATIDRAVALVG